MTLSDFWKRKHAQKFKRHKPLLKGEQHILLAHATLGYLRMCELHRDGVENTEQTIVDCVHVRFPRTPICGECLIEYRKVEHWVGKHQKFKWAT